MKLCPRCRGPYPYLHFQGPPKRLRNPSRNPGKNVRRQLQIGEYESEKLTLLSSKSGVVVGKVVGSFELATGRLLLEYFFERPRFDAIVFLKFNVNC